MQNNILIHKFRFFFISLLVFTGCSSISIYDYHSYETATSLKAEVSSLINNGTGEFSKYETIVNELTLKIEKAYEYEKGKPKNSITARMWEKMKDPNGGLYGEFIKLW